MKCVRCDSTRIQKDGNNKGFQRYRCLDCNKRFNGEKYESNIEQIVHFSTKINKTDRNNLTRDNYCIPTTKISYKEKKNIQIAASYKDQKKIPELVKLLYADYFNIPNEKYADSEHYKDEFVDSHYKNCMENYDLNIKYFNSINHDEFNDYLLSFVKKYNFIEINDLNFVKEKRGIYIMVLDNYNQAYIGKSNNIKKRIISHWSKNKEFGELLNGKVDESILSIDSFGALDTTRIFYKEISWYKNIDESEEIIENSFNDEYKLNRTKGGLNNIGNSTLRSFALSSNFKSRKLK